MYRIRWEKLEFPSEGWRYHRTAVDGASLPLARNECTNSMLEIVKLVSELKGEVVS